MTSNMLTQEPMTLGNMRINGVRSLSVYCLGSDWHHQAMFDVSRYPIMSQYQHSARVCVANAAVIWDWMRVRIG